MAVGIDFDFADVGVKDLSELTKVILAYCNLPNIEFKYLF